MKCLFAFAVSAIAICAMADEEYISPITGKPIPKDSKYTIEQIKERDGRVLKKTGGFVDVESKGVAVAVLDGRQKPGGSAIQFSDVFGSLSKTNVKVERNPLVTGTNAVDAAIAFRDAQKAAYAIVIVDSAELRGLTVIPEDRVAIINAAYYRDGAAIRSNQRCASTRKYGALWALWPALGMRLIQTMLCSPSSRRKSSTALCIR